MVSSSPKPSTRNMSRSSFKRSGLPENDVTTLLMRSARSSGGSLKYASMTVRKFVSKSCIALSPSPSAPSPSSPFSGECARSRRGGAPSGYMMAASSSYVSESVVLVSTCCAILVSSVWWRFCCSSTDATDSVSISAAVRFFPFFFLRFLSWSGLDTTRMGPDRAERRGDTGCCDTGSSASTRTRMSVLSITGVVSFILQSTDRPCPPSTTVALNSRGFNLASSPSRSGAESNSGRASNTKRLRSSGAATLVVSKENCSVKGNILHTTCTVGPSSSS
mmetsp:Transcript_50151/g.125902  ORF Transcript_50151/g.125902 Transcript_50151/m.125902 type:complete len:277 (+) Transcript_50151:430-1260(+)